MRMANWTGFLVSIVGLWVAAPTVGEEFPKGPEEQGGPGQRRPEERRARMFEELDANHDGQITREEFAAHKPFRPNGKRGQEGGEPRKQGFGGQKGSGPRPPGDGESEQRPRGPLAGPRGEGPGPDGPGENEPPRQNRRGGPPMFPVMDKNHDGKLQPAEIQRFIDVFTKALKASQEEDLTPEDWMDLVGELKPAGGFGGKPNRPPGNPDSPHEKGQRGEKRPPPPPQ